MARMVMAYECQYCRALKRTKNLCIRHEQACKQNPDSKNCSFCIHSKLYDKPMPGGGRLWCEKRQIPATSAVGPRCENFTRKE